MSADLRLHLFDRRTGANLARGTFAIVQKELQRGELVCIVADSEDGRRLSLQIQAEQLEDVPPPPPELTLISAMSIERSAHLVDREPEP
jgi:hypothetical protein